MNNDTDVLEFDFPDYEEPYPPFPDVKVESFDKEDSYSRNRDIADKFYAEEKQIKEKNKTVRKARRREIKIRKTVALAACLALCAALTVSALSYLDSITEQPKTVLSEKEKDELLAWRIKSSPFLESAKITAIFEGAEKDYADSYAVIINFTVENTSDEEIGFVPHRFYLRLQSGGVVSPNIADTRFFYGDYENPWYGMYAPAGGQISFSVKYYLSEKNVSQIKCFAYKVYGDYLNDTYLYADITDEDGNISRLAERKIESAKRSRS